MGILNKVKFWKKDDIGEINLGLGDEVGLDRGAALGDKYADPLAEQRQQFPQPSFQESYPQPVRAPAYQPRAEYNAKDMEIVMAKLDALHAMLDNIGRRLETLEQQQQQAYEPRRRTW